MYDNIGILKHEKTHDFLVQVWNFILPLSLKVFRHKERDTIFLYWFSISPKPCATPATRPRQASESQPSSSEAKLNSSIQPQKLN